MGTAGKLTDNNEKIAGGIWLLRLSGEMQKNITHFAPILKTTCRCFNLFQRLRQMLFFERAAIAFHFYQPETKADELDCVHAARFGA